jgi:exosortase/archaeosortase family protein
VIIGSDALASDYFNYVLLIPFISLYLIYRKRRMLAAVLPLHDDAGRGYLNQTIGISSMLVSLIIYLLGSLTSYPLEYHLIALEILIGATVLLLFNRQTLRILALPVLLITAALPSLTQFGLSIWLGLSWLSGYTSYHIAAATGVSVSFTTVSDVPALVVLTRAGEALTFVVGVASSGTYSLMGFSFFAFIVAYIAKGPISRRVLLFALGFPLLLVINVLRITLIVGAAYLWGDFAESIFHLTSGLFLVAGLTLLLLVVGERFFKLDYFGPVGKNEQCDLCDKEKSLGHNFCVNCGRFLCGVRRALTRHELASIAVISLVVIIFLSSLAPAVATTNTPGLVDLRSLTPQGALTFLPKIPRWNLTYLGQDQTSEQALQEDAALLYSYTQINQTGNLTLAQSIYVAVLVSPTIHTPEGSLVQWPQMFGRKGATVFVDQDEQILANPPVIWRYFVYQRPTSNLTEALLYWKARSLFNFGSYSDFRNVQIQLWDYTFSLADTGMIKNMSDYQGAFQAYLFFATHIANFWAPQKTTALLQQGIKQYYVPLSGLVIVPSVGVAGMAWVKRRKGARVNKYLATKLGSPNDRRLLEAVSLSTSDGIPTLENIRHRYNVPTNANLSFSECLSALTYAERLGLIKERIVDVDGEPRMIWRNAIHMHSRDLDLHDQPQRPSERRLQD